MKKLALLLALFVLAIAAGSVLSGCGGNRHEVATTSAPPPIRHKRHASPRHRVRYAMPRRIGLTVGFGYPGITGVPRPSSGALILTPNLLMIVTVGSSSCPNVPSKLTYPNRNLVEIRLVKDTRKGEACAPNRVPTMVDLAISWHRIDIHHSLTARIYYPGRAKPVVRIAPPI